MAFARMGARIGLIARQADSLTATAEGVNRAGGTGLPLPLDLANADAVRAAADRTEEELGPIDLWVNAAMLTVFSPIQKLSAQEDPAGDGRHLPRFSERRPGSARAHAPAQPRHGPQVGSALAYRGIPLQSAYCGAKFAIRGFLGSLHSELESEGSSIRVCMVELPAVNTPQFNWARAHVPGEPRPVAPVFQPEAVADALVKAALDPRREYWLGWSSIKTIVGAQLMPEYLDTYLAHHVISGQQSEHPVMPDRIDNLETPAPEEMHRAHGRFDEELGTGPGS